ncbi:MAG: energy transducer TonB [Pseudomonadales bacterium]|nr:energy transducer TonB [Pseudomonadales bacterium]
MSSQAEVFIPQPYQVQDVPDRMGFTLFMALLVHVVIILGVGFELADRHQPSASLEVTLAQYRSEKAPDEADFLAQANQQGSGNADRKLMQTTSVEAQRPRNEVAPLQASAQAQAPSQHSGSQAVLTAIQSQRSVASIRKNPRSDAPIERQISLLENSLEIASLEAQLANRIQLEANKPKIRTISAASTKFSIDAYYLDGWRRKVEMVGNSNYPKEAARLNLFGSLRMMVAIKPDGSIKEIRILKSSGKRALDNAAIRIVKLAAPFAAFPDELRKEVGILQIIRTWKFQQNQYSLEY